MTVPAKARNTYPSWLTDARNIFERDFILFLETEINYSHLKKSVSDAVFPGRRIRSSLFYAFWKLRNESYPRLEDMLPAAAIELFHCASIIVDDVMDREIARRNKTPLYRLYDTETAHLVAHFLVAAGYKTLLRHPLGKELSEYWTECYNRSIIGQSLDLRFYQTDSLELQQKRSLEKTAPFFSFIAHALDASGRVINPDFIRLFEYIGQCFQVSNDVCGLLFFEESQRYNPEDSYRLSVSHFVPMLVKERIVEREEVFGLLPYERHQEISEAAKKLLPSMENYLNDHFREVCGQIKRLLVSRSEREMAIEFIEQMKYSAFWLHNHEQKK